MYAGGFKPRFYRSADLRLESAICLRSTSAFPLTPPRWPLAQLFRYPRITARLTLITGNRQWARARTYKSGDAADPLDLQSAAPFVNETGSIPARWTTC